MTSPIFLQFLTPPPKNVKYKYSNAALEVICSRIIVMSRQNIKRIRGLWVAIGLIFVVIYLSPSCRRYLFHSVTTSLLWGANNAVVPECGRTFLLFSASLTLSNSNCPFKSGNLSWKCFKWQFFSNCFRLELLAYYFFQIHIPSKVDILWEGH